MRFSTGVLSHGHASSALVRCLGCIAKLVSVDSVEHRSTVVIEVFVYRAI